MKIEPMRDATVGPERLIHSSSAVDARDVVVIATNLRVHLSGVTSTIIQLMPVQRRQHEIAALGFGLPPELPRLSWRQVPWLWRRPRGRPFRIWHARRNVEMVAGVLLRDVLRAPMRLVFTSAARRRHRWFTRFLLRRMDAVIAASQGAGDFLEVPYAVIPHGVDCVRFHPPSGAEDRFDASNLPGKFAVGCCGRIRAGKGTDLFVDAMIRLLPRYSDWTAFLTGRVMPEHRLFYEDLKRRIASAGLRERIVFLGEVPDVGVWYRRMSLYVAPSRKEGFGLTPLEAMASQTPVVASDAGAYAELIRPGVTGQVVPAGDLEALIAAIEPYLANPAKGSAEGANAVEHVRAHFQIDKEAAQIGQVYESLWRGASAGADTGGAKGGQSGHS